VTKLAYILAASHSGSTLLAMLLGAHRETCTVGELKATSLGDVETYRCSCGEVIKQCGFWAQVSERMARRGISFDIAAAGTDLRARGDWYTRRLLKPLHRGPILERVRDAALSLSPVWRTLLAQIQRRNAALVESVCAITGTSMVIDSSKIALRLKYLLQSPAVDAKVIRLIRDGRAVALTYMDPAKYAGGRGACAQVTNPRPSMSMEEAAYCWRRSNDEADHLLNNLDSSRWIELRYEEYCSNPDAALQKAFIFLGLDPAHATRDFRSFDTHVLGNEMRFDSTSEVRLDERWRNVLTKEELRIFDRTAGRLNRKYGYG